MKPILFNTEMVRAILEGRKTVTRRVVKPQPDERHQYKLGYVVDSTDKKVLGCFGFGIDEYGGSIQYAKPPYQVNDILYVRETWCNWADDIGNNYFYKATDDGVDGFSPKWKPSIHMPKEAARIFLKVTGVRVERLQDITEEQAIAEGIREYTKDGKLYKYAVSIDWWEAFHYKYRKLFKRNWWQDMPRTAREAFHYLWHSTLGRKDTPEYYAYNWKANPYVWVIEFEPISKELAYELERQKEAT